MKKKTVKRSVTLSYTHIAVSLTPVWNGIQDDFVLPNRILINLFTTDVCVLNKTFYSERDSGSVKKPTLQDYNDIELQQDWLTFSNLSIVQW